MLFPGWESFVVSKTPISNLFLEDLQLITDILDREEVF